MRVTFIKFGRRLQYPGTKRREYIVQDKARKMQSNRGDLGTDDNCCFKNNYKTKHFLHLYPGFFRGTGSWRRGLNIDRG